MTCVFLAVNQPGRSTFEAEEELLSYLPFKPEESIRWVSPDQATTVCAWSVLSEAARGSYWSTGDQRAVVYDGWFVESSSVSIDETVADGFVDTHAADGVTELPATLPGEWSAVDVSSEEVSAATDFLGSRHLYFGQREGRAVVSNRSMVAAAALYGGELPPMRPMYFGWLMTLLAAPFDEETPFPSVRLLSEGHAVRLSDGQCRTTRAFEPGFGDEPVDWNEWTAEFVDRCRQLKRFPKLTFQLGLTGGKDSRLVLGGLHRAEVLDRIDFAYLRAEDDNPDAVVGRRLADEYGIDFRTIESRSEPDVFEAIDRHNFQTEFGLNAWDLKGCDLRERKGAIHGNLGETYRGHAQLQFALGWQFVRNYYGSNDYVDPAGVLTAEARHHCRKRLMEWIESRRRQNHPRLRVHDAYHRHGRMHRWVGHAQIADGCGVLCANPIPSPGLFRVYRRLGLKDRQGERIHYELMRRLDDRLWRRPFADARWSPLLPKAALQGASPVTGDSSKPPPQLRRWRRRRDDIHAYLLEPRSSPFFDLVDRRRLIDFVDGIGDNPDFPTLRAVWGLFGIRRALDEPVRPRLLTMEAA